MKIPDRKAITFIKRFLIPPAILFVIVIVFFRDISLADIQSGFFKIPFTYFVAFILLSLLGTLLRAWKYRILLSGQLAYKDIFLITLVRNFSVDLLPGRAAALGFYAWLTKKKGIAIEESAPSFVVSAFYDTMALALMLAGLTFSLDAAISHWPLFAIMAVLFILSAVVIFLSDRFFQFLLKGNILRRLHLVRFERTIFRILNYLRAHNRNSERLTILLLSFATRIIKYVHNFILFEGVLHLGTGLKNFSLFCFGLAATETSSLVPIQGPAGFGTWELAFTFVFSTLQIPATHIREAGFVIHVTSQAWEYAIGFMALFYLAFSRTAKKPAAGQPETKG